MKTIKFTFQILELAFLLLIMFTAGCYNDSEEYLYPEQPGNCDTTSITFNGSILPITDGYCKGCHSGSNPSAGVNIENYNQVKALADDGRLVNTINAANGYPLMPQGSELSTCSKRIIEKWIESGALNN